MSRVSKEKSFARFFVQPDAALTPGINSIFRATKLEKNEIKRKEGCVLKSEWILKKAESRDHAQVEAAIAAIYRLIDPNCIPKVRVIAPEKEGGDYHIASKKISVFEPLKSFIKEDQDYLKFLIENGIATVLGLSYFFGEEDLNRKNMGRARDNKIMRIDTGRSAFPFLQARGLASRLMYTSVFTITERDLDSFPILHDATPYYFPTLNRSMASVNGYSVAENEAFGALNNFPAFLESFYRDVALKIILIPDELYCAEIDAHMDTPLSREFKEYVLGIKKELREKLFGCNQFKKYWGNWSLQTIINLFSKNNLIEKIQSAYCVFSLEMMRPVFEEDLATLSSVNSDAAKLFSDAMEKYYHEKEITQFIEKTKTVMEKKEGEIFLKIAMHLALLEKQCTQRVAARHEDVVVVNEFIDVPTLSEDALITHIVQWIHDTDNNKAVILQLLHDACNAYHDETNSWSAWATFGMYGCRKKSEFLEYTKKLSEARDGHALSVVLSRLLSEQGAGADLLKKIFVTKLIQKFSEDFSKQHILNQIKKHPEFASYLQSQPKNQLPEDKIPGIVPKLTDALEPRSESLLGVDGDWNDVTHSSSTTVNVSLCKLPK